MTIHAFEYSLRNPQLHTMRGILRVDGEHMDIVPLGDASFCRRDLNSGTGTIEVVVLLPSGSDIVPVARIQPTQGREKPNVRSASLSATKMRPVQRSENDVGGVVLIQTLTPHENGDTGGQMAFEVRNTRSRDVLVQLTINGELGEDVNFRPRALVLGRETASLGGFIMKSDGLEVAWSWKEDRNSQGGGDDG